jgi:hypothetical protein
MTQDKGASASADRAVAASPSSPSVSPLRASIPSAGYAEAFYEIAKMLGLEARPETPAEVWQEQMRPMLATRIAAYEPLKTAVDEAHAALAKLPSNTLGFAEDGYGNRWPIHSELLDRMWKAIAIARGEA